MVFNHTNKCSSVHSYDQYGLKDLFAALKMSVPKWYHQHKMEALLFKVSCVHFIDKPSNTRGNTCIPKWELLIHLQYIYIHSFLATLGFKLFTFRHLDRRCTPPTCRPAGQMISLYPNTRPNVREESSLSGAISRCLATVSFYYEFMETALLSESRHSRQKRTLSAATVFPLFLHVLL